jgi:hypothetical protein
MSEDTVFQIRATTRRDIAAVDALLARAYPRLLKGDYPPSTLVDGCAVDKSRTACAGGLWDLLCG